MTRINARLERELAERLLVVQERTGLSASDVLKASLRSYFAAIEAKAAPAELLADFVGSAQGSEALSSTYKAELTASLERKHRP